MNCDKRIHHCSAAGKYAFKVLQDPAMFGGAANGYEIR